MRHFTFWTYRNTALFTSLCVKAGMMISSAYSSRFSFKIWNNDMVWKILVFFVWIFTCFTHLNSTSLTMIRSILLTVHTPYDILCLISCCHLVYTVLKLFKLKLSILLVEIWKIKLELQNTMSNSYFMIANICFYKQLMDKYNKLEEKKIR